MSGFQTSLFDISKTSILLEPFYDFEKTKLINSIHNNTRNPFEVNQWLSTVPKDSNVLRSLCSPTQQHSQVVDFDLPRGAQLMTKIHLHITVPQIFKSD